MAFHRDYLKQSFTKTLREYCEGEFRPGVVDHYWFNCTKEHVLGETIPLEVSWQNQDKPSVNTGTTCEHEEVDADVLRKWWSFQDIIRRAYSEGRVHFRPTDPCDHNCWHGCKGHGGNYG